MRPAPLRDVLTAVDAGLPERLAGAVDRDEPPWYVRGLMGFGAWVSALLFMIGFAMLDLLRDDGVRGVLGGILFAAGFALRRKADGDFRVQLALSAGVLGIGLFDTMLVETSGDEEGLAVTLMVTHLAALVFPDVVFRFLTALAALGAGVVLLLLIGGPVLVELPVLGLAALMVWVWWRPLPTNPRHIDLVRPIAFAVPIALYAMLVIGIVPQGETHSGWISAVGMTALGAVVATLVARDLGRSPLPGAVAAGLIGALTWSTPGVVAAAAGLAIGFHRRSVTMAGIAAAFLLGFLISFYYFLGVDLLTKSLALIGAGAALLLLRAWFRRAR